MERKFNEELISQLRNKEVIAEHGSKGVTDDLVALLRYAFPTDKSDISGNCDYYGKWGRGWAGFNETEITGFKKVLVSDFFLDVEVEVNNYEIF